MKNYECLFIINPDAASERFDHVKTAIRSDIERYHGVIEKTEELGQRTLAYPINRCEEGFYYLLQFRVDPRAIGEIRTRYRHNQDILRFLITVME
ncbi:MAG: 30S ribosomal protein S6 [bacterium]|nr:30S ribosomal protein S6 [bacterium]